MDKILKEVQEVIKKHKAGIQRELGIRKILKEVKNDEICVACGQYAVEGNLLCVNCKNDVK